MMRRIAFLVSAGSLVVAPLIFNAAENAPQKFVLTSSAFSSGGDIPRKYTCDAEDISPSLRWTHTPPPTKSLALIADDPDAPGGTWVHWVIYNLPQDSNSLAEGVAKKDLLPSGAKQGVNDFRKIGYNGPCPPPGATHHYHFKLYALDAAIGLEPGATKQQLLDAIKQHVLGESELIGRYKR